MPKIVDHDERRDHIADAATKVIAREGFERLTMRQIAAEAGYTHGAIARYFPTKESLLTASFVRLHVQANGRILTEVAGKRGLDALEQMCREILPFGDLGPKYARVVIAFWDHASQDTRVTQIHRENNQRWRDQFRRFLLEAREDGELADHIDIDTAVGEVASRNAGWQMVSVLLPEVAGDERIEAGLQALLGELRGRPADGSGRRGRDV